MFKPNSIHEITQANGAITATCEKGIIKVTPYRANVVHFAYYPQQECTLPMWGICGTPSKQLPVELAARGEHCVIKTARMTVELNRKTGQVTFYNAAGRTLLCTKDYSLTATQKSGEDTYSVSLAFDAPDDEHYYGLGQHQEGQLDYRGSEVPLWHDYSHKGGEVVAVPFMVTNKGYAFLFDNCSKTSVSPGINHQTLWQADVADAISFFVISGDSSDELYSGYRELAGITPIPPKSGLGFIQCKQRYASRDELMQVAKAYREKQYPCDMLIVDWFHWKVLGDLSLDETFWPNAKQMNEELEKMGYEVMVSCWPRFMKESTNYDLLEKNHWFMWDKNGNTVYGTPEDQRGALIDTTNPDCGRWYWQTIRKNYGDNGFKYWWTDENEPDISPYEYNLHAGTGARVHNLYPLTHTESLYEGHRKDYKHRCFILSRAAYIGAQRYGTTFWSSDIYPEWDVLKRQIPTALNFCASGMPYWSSDIGAWQPLADEESDEDYRALLMDTKNDTAGDVNKSNYAELFIRWFQFGAFCPTFRTHGTRKHNEVWSYGEQAEKILVKYLNLRYKLMPYIYSLAYKTKQTGAPFMRALWQDFGDENVFDCKDEFMFGPALLVAPVTEKGSSSRQVYLPKDSSWYDFWTNKLYGGGQSITVHAPIDTLPLFVKAGSIIPTGEIVPSAQTEQKDIKVLVYPGASCEFALYSDDGQTYAYEQGDCCVTSLRWDEHQQQLTIKDDTKGLFTRGQQEWLAVIKQI